MKNIKTIRRLQRKVKDMKTVKEMLKNEKQKFEDLKKMIECPVCLDVPRKGPIFACPNGHIICEKCKEDLCPICRGHVGHNKSIVAAALVEKILHDCKFDGCEAKHPLHTIEKHEKVCYNRIVICPHYLCEEKVQLSKVMGHLSESPSCCINKVPRLMFGSSLVQTYESRLENLGQSCTWPVLIFSYSGTLCALQVSKFSDYYHFTVVMFESAEFCSGISMEIEVYEKQSSSDTRLSTRLRCYPCSIDEVKWEMKHLGLTVHHKIMEKLVLREESFDFTVCITFF